MNKQELQQWVKENELENGKIRNREIVSILNKALDNDELENVGFIVDKMDIDFFNSHDFDNDNVLKHSLAYLIVKE